MRHSISLLGVSSWSFLLHRSADFSVPAGNRIFIFPCRRSRLLDTHALPPPAKPGKSRQIVASRTADPRASDQATIFASISASLRRERLAHGAGQCEIRKALAQ